MSTGNWLEAMLPILRFICQIELLLKMLAVCQKLFRELPKIRLLFICLPVAAFFKFASFLSIQRDLWGFLMSYISMIKRSWRAIADVAISKCPLLFTVWTQLHLRSHQNFYEIFTANSFCQLLGVTRKRSCTYASSAQVQLHFQDDQQRAFGISNISNWELIMQTWWMIA